MDGFCLIKVVVFGRCGLVALHMAAQMVKLLQPSISQPSVLEIFNKAIEMELSKQGEMFSGDLNRTFFDYNLRGALAGLGIDTQKSKEIIDIR